MSVEEVEKSVVMKNFQKSYWLGNGKYSESSKKIVTPNWGNTDNDNLNFYLAISKLYYDINNNGGCNIYDCYKEKIGLVKKYLKQFNIKRFIKDFEYRESKLDEVFELILDKDLTFTVYKAYFIGHEKVSKSEKDDWDVITFGLELERDNWVNTRVNYCGALLIE